MQKRTQSEQLAEFLNFVDQYNADYKTAFDAVNKEDRRLQDLVHEMEFAENKAERNKVATKLHRSRVTRRKNKDIVQRNERIVNFFAEPNHKSTLNKLRQLLGQQRKMEEYLDNEREYKPRVKEKE